MQQYLDLLKTIVSTGTQQANRTGIDTLMIPGAMLQFNLQEGFPAVTTKKLAFKKVVGENIGFLRGYTNAADFRELGCDIWDANANENKAWLANKYRKGQDDLGRIYGAQWTDWKQYSFYSLDKDTGGEVRDLSAFDYPQTCDVVPYSINQVNEVLWKLKNNPTDRRMIINAWRPDEFEYMALPPCHVLYQFLADNTNKTLHLCMYQRSCDMFLGVPFNIAGSAIFLTIMARLSGFNVGTFTHFLADAHVYVNHLDQVKEQVSRKVRELPTLECTIPFSAGDYPDNWAFFIKPEHFELQGYDPHPFIKAPMAV